MLAGVFAASLLQAQTPDAPKSFDELDVDGDGQISVYEAEADRRLLEAFNSLDANGDGHLSREEFAALPDPQ